MNLLWISFFKLFTQIDLLPPTEGLTEKADWLKVDMDVARGKIIPSPVSFLCTKGSNNDSRVLLARGSSV